MAIRKTASLWIVCATLALFFACQQEEETRLRLQFSPSLNLSQYDSIEVALVLFPDTSTVATLLFAGPFDSMPASWPLPSNLGDGEFAVRVRAYKFEGQLGKQFYLVKQPGQSTATATVSTVEEPLPYSHALQSIGAQSGVATPAFDTSEADTNYQVTFPHTVDTAKISPAPVDTRAQIFIGTDASPFAPGDTLRIPLDPGTFVPTRITVRNHGIERRYHLSLGRDSTLDSL